MSYLACCPKYRMQNAFKEWLLNAWVTWNGSKVFEKHAVAREVQMTSVVKTSSLAKDISVSLENSFSFSVPCEDWGCGSKSNSLANFE